MAGAALLLAACGGRAADSPNDPTSPMPALARGVLLQQGFALDPAKVTYLDFEVPPYHTLGITVDWTFASNNVIVALTSSECPDITTAVRGGCLARTASWAPTFPPANLERRKPRVLTYNSINVTVPARPNRVSSRSVIAPCRPTADGGACVSPAGADDAEGAAA